jgi:hypothetical protein
MIESLAEIKSTRLITNAFLSSTNSQHTTMQSIVSLLFIHNSHPRIQKCHKQQARLLKINSIHDDGKYFNMNNTFYQSLS